MNVAYNNAGSGSGIFAPTPRRLGCPIKKENPDRYMFAQHATSLSGPVAPIPFGEDKASRAYYKREMPAPVRNETHTQPNQDDGLGFYMPAEHHFLGTNEMAEVMQQQVSPLMNMSETRLLHGHRQPARNSVKIASSTRAENLALPGPPPAPAPSETRTPALPAPTPVQQDITNSTLAFPGPSDAYETDDEMEQIPKFVESC